LIEANQVIAIVIAALLRLQSRVLMLATTEQNQFATHERTTPSHGSIVGHYSQM
jgi:hypothetical protein